LPSVRIWESPEVAQGSFSDARYVITQALARGRFG
jgi:hypothetical protein